MFNSLLSPFSSVSASDAVAQLRIVDLLVDGAGLHQLAVRAFRGDPALVDDDDLVGLQHGADALRDHKAGAVAACSASSASWIFVSVSTSTELVLSSRIRILGWVEQRAGDGDALLLPAGQVDAALLDVGVVALGQLPG